MRSCVVVIVTGDSQLCDISSKRAYRNEISSVFQLAVARSRAVWHVNPRIPGSMGSLRSIAFVFLILNAFRGNSRHSSPRRAATTFNLSSISDERQTQSSIQIDRQTHTYIHTHTQAIVYRYEQWRHRQTQITRAISPRNQTQNLIIRLKGLLRVNWMATIRKAKESWQM